MSKFVLVTVSDNKLIEQEKLIANSKKYFSYTFPDQPATIAELDQKEKAEFRSLLGLVDDVDIDLAGINIHHEIIPDLSFFDLQESEKSQENGK